MVVAGALMGATFQAGMVIWGTLLQRRVPPALLDAPAAGQVPGPAAPAVA